MNFSDVMREESRWTKTENGADAKNTTDSALLDMFATIGSMRSRSEDEIIQKFELAFQEDPLGAMRCLFYCRDIRGGQGERRVFRVLLPYIAEKHTDVLDKNIGFIPEYGRYDDFYSLIGTKSEEKAWDIISTQLLEDKVSMQNGNPCSLLAKWLKKADASSPNTRKLGIYTAKKLGMSVYDYKRLCVKLRRYIDVVEQRMSANEWDTINYPAVPSRAMMNYRKAFARHDEERFNEYLNKVQSGEQKINSATLYPYDIVEKILYGHEDNKVLEAQWDNLPDYVDGDVNAVVMADVSGSMYGRPLATSIGLAMYFAERNKGAYHNLFMTFSQNPKFVAVKGETITQKIKFISRADWGMNTDLENDKLTVNNMEYINIPINLKWKYSLPVIAVFATAGPQFSFLADKSIIAGQITGIKRNSTEIGFNLGLGVEFFKALQISAGHYWATNPILETNAGEWKARTWTIGAAYLF